MHLHQIGDTTQRFVLLALLICKEKKTLDVAAARRFLSTGGIQARAKRAWRRVEFRGGGWADGAAGAVGGHKLRRTASTAHGGSGHVGHRDAGRELVNCRLLRTSLRRCRPPSNGCCRSVGVLTCEARRRAPEFAERGAALARRAFPQVLPPFRVRPCPGDAGVVLVVGHQASRWTVRRSGDRSLPSESAGISTAESGVAIYASTVFFPTLWPHASQLCCCRRSHFSSYYPNPFARHNLLFPFSSISSQCSEKLRCGYIYVLLCSL